MLWDHRQSAGPLPELIDQRVLLPPPPAPARCHCAGPRPCEQAAMLLRAVERFAGCAGCSAPPKDKRVECVCGGGGSCGSRDAGQVPGRLDVRIVRPTGR